MKYTKNQQAAIDARGESLLISAAAGSGKTRVLVDRIVTMLAQDKIPLAQMLIVTFTNAAAGEMKARLRQGLEEAARAAAGDDKAFLLAQLDALAEAHISTMHAFCITELRRFYHVVGLDPNFRVLPETTTTILREEALEKIMDAAYEAGDPGFLALVEAYGGRSGDEALREMVRSLYGRIQSHAAPLQWLEEEVARYSGGLPAVYVDMLAAQIEEAAQAMSSAIAQARTLADTLPNAVKYHEMLAEDESVLAGLRKTMKAEDALTAFCTYVQGVKWAGKPRKSSKLTMEEAGNEERLAALRKAYKKTFDGLKPLTAFGDSDAVAADRALLHPHLQALAALIGAYDAAYRAAKKEREGLDFNDLEHEMLRLLTDDGARAAVREEIQYIFFDEYQDANPIQEAIVEALAHEGQLFFVGDVKQAIYRFRRADPNIFNRRYARYRDSDDGQLIFLSENFRSRGEILSFANALFGTLMTPALGDVDYLEPGQALVCGGEFAADDDAVQGVCVCADVDSQAEARWIAAEISRLVDSGRYDYGDMVVLMRSPRRRLADFEEVFKAHHIPYYSDNSTVGFDNLEVRLFIAMLQVLNNDALDQPLLAALLSPFGGLDDSELAKVRLSAPEDNMATACRAYSAAQDDPTARKLRHFYEALADWRAALRYESLYEVALRMFQESGYGAFLLGMEGGTDRHNNLQSFIELIRDYETNHRYSLPGFLHYVETLKARSMDSATPGIALTENDHCVRIMSIHKSKGLGFPVVFLADLAHQFNLRDMREPVLIDDVLGIAANVVDLARSTTHPSFEKTLMAAKSRRETLSEEVRLLYVALTRAIDRLYLVSTLSDKALEKWQKKYGTSQSSPAALRAGRSYLDWLATLACDKEHALFAGASKPLYRWQLVDGADTLAADEAQTPNLHAILAQADDALVAEAAARFHANYPYAEATTQPFKRTVSELAKANRVLPDYMDEWPAVDAPPRVVDEVVPVPDFLREHLSFTGAALGTLMHQVVQWLPLAVQSRDEVIAGLDRLEKDAFLTADERAAVDVDMLEAFYAGDFVKRLTTVAYRIEREVSFTMRLEPYMVDGQIDLFYETDDGYEIVDFKTDRRPDAGRYHNQLALYAQALEIARGKPVTHKWLYWLRHHRAEEV